MIILSLHKTYYNHIFHAIIYTIVLAILSLLET